MKNMQNKKLGRPGLVSRFLLPLLACLTVVLTSCEKEEDYGVPVITNIRVTDPAKADSSLSGGSLGQMIVIQGNNLGSTQKVYFNSEEAFFNPTYVTDKNIIVRVPSGFPTEITNLIRVITKGGEATYQFPIDIPAPLANNLPLEFVPDGGTLVIVGEYFYNIESIEFGGDVSTTNFEVINPQTIHVIVPPGVEPGPVKVIAVAGTATTKSWFRDNRGMMVDFDEFPICWGGDAYVVNADSIPSTVPVNPISGNFYYIKQDYAAGTWWIQETVVAYCGDITATGGKADYAIAFEMWVGEKWDKNWFELEMFGDEQSIYYNWNGHLALGGADKFLEKTGWITVKIPLASMTSLQGSTFRMGRFGSYKAEQAATIEFAFDNFRLIPLN